MKEIHEQAQSRKFRVLIDSVFSPATAHFILSDWRLAAMFFDRRDAAVRTSHEGIASRAIGTAIKTRRAA